MNYAPIRAGFSLWFVIQLSGCVSMQSTNSAPEQIVSESDRTYQQALALFDGRGVKQDETKAVELFRELAATNHADAQNMLGVACARGRGTTRDPAEARRWYESAAKLGHAAAMYNIACLHDSAEGVPEDDRLAAEWYQRAADANYPAAQLNLGMMYADGTGVPADKEQAMKWTLISRTVARFRTKEKDVERRAMAAVDKLLTVMTRAEALSAQDQAHQWLKARGIDVKPVYLFGIPNK